MSIDVYQIPNKFRASYPKVTGDGYYLSDRFATNLAASIVAGPFEHPSDADVARDN